VTAQAEVLVLCHHAISEDWPAAIAVSPAELESQLGRLLDADYEPVTFSEAVAGRAGAKLLALTFDDAYASVYTRGRPLLERLGIPATVFVPTDHVGTDRQRSWGSLSQWSAGSWTNELLGISWDQLGALADLGWEVGSHSRSHPRLPELDDEALADELSGSRAECERRLGRSCSSIAYPYGEYDERVVNAARAAGYTAGATVSGRLPTDSSEDPLRWPRLGVNRRDRGMRLLLKSSLYRRPRAWNLLQRLRPETH
jgi:peptidoglycan/xylan/chitin deacetylase (PgdA/CDA1 family)